MTNLPHKILLPGLIALTWLAGCVSDQVDDDDQSWKEELAHPESVGTPPRAAPAPVTGSYRVMKGDTLYSIAFKRGLDYRDVAAWNSIAAPEYKILVGQELRFGPAITAAHPAPMPAVATVAAAPSKAAPAAPPAATSGSLFEDVSAESQHPASTAPIESAQVEPPASAPISPPVIAQTPAPSTPATTPPPTPAPIPTPVMPVIVPVKPAVETPPPTPAPVAAKPISDGATANVGGINWRWPSAGKVIGGFVGGDQTRQGVDIAGNAGDPVQAAADGEVVYSGNGLLGYGELIIVKHNANFLSAYGHNRKRLVQEGEKVHAGQVIAEMGSSASSRDELHFEIRKSGKPVNPADYLPPR